LIGLLFRQSLIVALFFFFDYASLKEVSAEVRNAQCERIVSLAPSITEQLDAIQLGSHIVAVSSFETHLPKLPKVGDLFHLSLEQLLEQNPTVVFLLHEQRAAARHLRNLQIPWLQLDHRSVEGIHSSLLEIGRFCGREQAAQALNSRIRKEAARITEESRAVLQGKTVRMLVVIGGTQQHLAMRKIVISGSDGFYYPLLKKLGIHPVFHEQTAGVGTLSLEHLATLPASHILHILSPQAPFPTSQELERIWAPFQMIPAVRLGNISALQERVLLIPSIRYPEAMKHILAVARMGNEE
jgi:iron complex transport system substrate-binding protein